MRKRREDTRQQCLEFPQLKQFVHQVVNDQRQDRPGIRVHPDGSATDKMGDIVQGMCRAIEADSSADAVYDTGFLHCVVGGRGYWRVISEYVPGANFNQVLRIRSIADPGTVKTDVDFELPDGSDINFAFIEERIKKTRFERRYPNAQPISWDVTGVARQWMEKDGLVIADWYRRVPKTRKLLLMSDGAVGWAHEFTDAVREQAAQRGVTVKRERDVETFGIEWYTLAGGQQFIDVHDWAGSIIPVVCCMGDAIMVEGRRVFQGLIRQAKDAQFLFNFERSAMVQRMSLSPLAPWVGPIEAFEGFEEMWRDANVEPFGYLPYNTVDDEKQPIPPPQRMEPTALESSWMAAAQAAQGDLRSIMGMYENTLGMKGQETSGRAILAREKIGDNSTFHFADNLARAIALTGRIIIECIPKYYDKKRIVALVGEDGERTQQMINQPVPNAQAPDDPAQMIIENDVTEGEFRVVPNSGPSYQTKREETTDFLTDMVGHWPQLMQVCGDLIMRNQDFSGAEEFADRLYAVLPPEIKAVAEARESGQDPKFAALYQQFQQLQQQLQQLTQQVIPQLQQQNQQLQQELKARGIDAQAKLEMARANQMKAQAVTVETQGKLADVEQAQQTERMDIVARDQQAVLNALVKLLVPMLTPQTPPQQVVSDINTIEPAVERAASPGNGQGVM
jgi:hypothetical protein